MSIRALRKEAQAMLEGAGDGPFSCLSCGEKCALKVTDEGIGAYEYWGAKGVDTKLVLSSECCDGEWEEMKEEEE